MKLFLADDYTNPGGKYFQRCPVMHAHKVRTPTLNICGALDRCKPPAIFGYATRLVAWLEEHLERGCA